MYFKAYCKINPLFDIQSKRPDGYHNIDTVMMPINLYDSISIQSSHNIDGRQDDSANRMVTVNWPPAYHEDGLTLKCNDPLLANEDNLIVKAFRIFRPHLKDVSFCVALNKTVPYGAGLGGGSSDAAVFMREMEKFFLRPLEEMEIKTLYEKVGADCYFFRFLNLCRARGIGTDFTVLKPNWKKIPCLLVNDGTQISTKEVYQKVLIKSHSFMDDAVTLFLQGDFSGLRVKGKNVLEDISFEIDHELPVIKKKLYDLGASFAQMSGSGATMFGFFSTDQQMEKAKKILIEHYPFVCATHALNGGFGL